MSSTPRAKATRRKKPLPPSLLLPTDQLEQQSLFKLSPEDRAQLAMPNGILFDPNSMWLMIASENAGAYRVRLSPNQAYAFARALDAGVAVFNASRGLSTAPTYGFA